MKCNNCGFTYDNEPVCPICGTPAAPLEQKAPFAPQPAPTVQAPIPAPSPCVEPDIEESKKPAAAKSGKGLKIAALCVLSVIAAALVANVAIQAVSLSAELKHYKKTAELTDKQQKLLDESLKYSEYFNNNYSNNNFIDDSFSGDESYGRDYIEPKRFTDGTIRKVGETFIFDYGTLTLKSIKPMSEMAVDNTKQIAALTLTVTNTTEKKLCYIHPNLSIGDTEFDGENFLFYESGSNDFSLNSGESASLVFYYKLPKENKKLDCNIDVYSTGENGVSDGSEYEFSAAVLYEFETKDVK